MRDWQMLQQQFFDGTAHRLNPKPERFMEAASMTTLPSFAALMAAGFRGAAVRAIPTDYDNAGIKVGVRAREIYAVIDVESGGAGFYASGRLKMLFEPHRFYAKLSGAKRDLAVKAGLAYPKWGTKPYPKDSYPRLIQAISIDETAALASCSWGLTQIMGENFRACGYRSPQEMVAAFAASEAAHLDATVLLIRAKGLDDELRAHDWPGLAKGWNGPQYAKNKYDTKLQLAFARRGSPVAGAAPRLAPVVAPKVAKAPVRASVRKPVPAGLPAVAPVTLGDLIAAFIGRLFAPAPTPA